MKTRILIADDESTICKLLKAEFESADFQVEVAHNGEEALSKLRRVPCEVIVLDVNMPVLNGMQVLTHIKQQGGAPVVIMMTAYGSIDGAVTAMKMQADDYIAKPFDPPELVEKVQQILEVRRKVAGLSRNGSQAPPVLLGKSAAMGRIQSTIQKVKDLGTTVLITGESGTGKGVVAKQIHMTSNRRQEPFIHIDCASLPRNLIESELFGHEKGAFTSAASQRRGKLELAGRGTIFLDEIGTLSPELQSKLLIVLQDRYFERLGGEQRIPVEARIIAATNEDLERAVEEGSFRADLYYRLNIIGIECPPLRNRREDILELARYFIQEHKAKTGIHIQSVDDGVWDALLDYDWPGNVRELENTMESAVILSDGVRVRIEDLPRKITARAAARAISGVGGSPLSLENQEIMTILAALDKHSGHRERTAQELGISRRTLQYKLAKYHIIK